MQSLRIDNHFTKYKIVATQTNSKTLYVNPKQLCFQHNENLGKFCRYFRLCFFNLIHEEKRE